MSQPDRRIGFTFENFDGMGALRDTDNNKTVNTATDLEAGTDIDGKFANSLEVVSNSEKPRACASASHATSFASLQRKISRG